jgi:hypothetical protein
VPSEAARLDGTARHLRLVPPDDEWTAPDDRSSTVLVGCIEEPPSVWVLTGVPRTPGRTRQLVRQWCAAWDLHGAVVEHTVLAANELVTRAVRRSAPRVVVSLALEAADVLVEVSDPLGGHRPRCQARWFGQPSPEEHCGLQMVDAVARSWGVSAGGRPDLAWARVPHVV